MQSKLIVINALNYWKIMVFCWLWLVGLNNGLCADHCDGDLGSDGRTFAESSHLPNFQPLATGYTLFLSNTSQRVLRQSVPRPAPPSFSIGVMKNFDRPWLVWLNG